MITFLLLALGIVFVIQGANMLVDGGASLAKKLGISQIVIGLTVVAFGTSMPEMVVNVFSAVRGVSGVSLGNIIGSNISNLLLVMGLSAVILPLTFQKEVKLKIVPYSLFAALLLMFLFNIPSKNLLSRVEGIVLLVLFSLFFYHLMKNRKGKSKKDRFKEYSLPVSSSYVIIGSILLFLGGKWTIDSAIVILTQFNISEMLISSTVLAVGTSLPELSASLTAVFKKNADIAVGNIIGSNIFNILLVLGVTSIIRPIEFISSWNTDILFLVAVTVLLSAFIFKKSKLKRWNGAIFILLYALYIAFLIIRG